MKDLNFVIFLATLVGDLELWGLNVPNSTIDLGGFLKRCLEIQPLRIQSPSQMMIGVYNHLLRKVFRFHYHSQKVIGSLGNIFSSPISKARSNFWGLSDPSFFFFQFISSSSIFWNPICCKFGNFLKVSVWQLFFLFFLPAEKHDLLRKWTCNSLQILLSLRCETCVFFFK